MHSLDALQQATLPLLLSVSITVSDACTSIIHTGWSDLTIHSAVVFISNCIAARDWILWVNLSPIYPHHPTLLEFFIQNSSRHQRLDWLKFHVFTPSLVEDSLVIIHTFSGARVFIDDLPSLTRALLSSTRRATSTAHSSLVSEVIVVVSIYICYSSCITLHGTN